MEKYTLDSSRRPQPSKDKIGSNLTFRSKNVRKILVAANVNNNLLRP
jgi:hypothetical protein